MRAALVLASFACVLATTHVARADDAWTGKDKTLHFGVSAGIASAGYVVGAAVLEARGHALLVGGGAALLAGAGKELLDLTGLGDPSWKDFAWDCAGNVAGLAVAWAIDLAVRGISREHPLLVAPAVSSGGAGAGIRVTF